MKIYLITTALPAISYSLFSEKAPCGHFKIDGRKAAFGRNAPFKIEIYYPPDS